jgi:DNA modification methylase
MLEAPPAVARVTSDIHTFRGNLKSTRHGWLRLTPAYSVRLVASLLERAAPPLLDPFCGTGTTLLASAEHGVACDTVDINPFLLWLARAKVAHYPAASIGAARRALKRISVQVASGGGEPAWLPPMFQIERWWGPEALSALGRSAALLRTSNLERPAANLLWLAFCHALIESSNANFGHQSMSIHRTARAGGERAVLDTFEQAFERFALAAAVPLPRSSHRILKLDARRLHTELPRSHYGAVITSPPYANRMSYVRELRPYMYWLGYLADKASAGALDWQAIGGTWGVATSNLTRWQADPKLSVTQCGLSQQLHAIGEHSPVLANYVHKYFQDMLEHVSSLAHVLRPGGSAFFVVGNSKFYDVLLPVQEILAALFETKGFRRANIEVLRKRSSKKELFEYLVSAERR